MESPGYRGDRRKTEPARDRRDHFRALPGRTFDLAGPGWQQEHWSLAPMRGFGLHRGWLPWVATSQLNGILGLLDVDPEIYRALTGAR